MKHLQDSYRGLSLFVGLNIDRMLSLLMVTFAILLACYLGSL